jgi:hypothetical protein
MGRRLAVSADGCRLSGGDRRISEHGIRIVGRFRVMYQPGQVVA